MVDGRVCCAAMLLSLVPSPVRRAVCSDLGEYPFAETPLNVAFAAVDDLGAVGPGARVALGATPDVSPDDAYLVLPRRARERLQKAFATGDQGVIMAWMHAAMVVRAEVDTGAAPRLWVGAAWRASEVIASQRGRSVKFGSETVREVNCLSVVERVSPDGLVDAETVETVLRRECYVGPSRRGEWGECEFLWSEHDESGVRVRAVLAVDEEWSGVMLLAPMCLVAQG